MESPLRDCPGLSLPLLSVLVRWGTNREVTKLSVAGGTAKEILDRGRRSVSCVDHHPEAFEFVEIAMGRCAALSVREAKP